jgi:hypothetical protein
MKCEDCQELISVFLDNELENSQASDVRSHLAQCPPCAKVYEDFTSILDVCHSQPPSELVPPNSQALWCRINNIIESEVKPPPEPPRKSGLWHLSFSQLASAVLCIAVVSSLLTVIGIKNYMTPAADDFTTRSADTQTTFERLMSKVGLVDTPQMARDRRIKEQQAAIDYWNRRVSARRVQWDQNMRDAFDRNLNEIDKAVNEYTLILQQNPDDDLSGEMLDSALNEKMNLLREFSDL